MSPRPAARPPSGPSSRRGGRGARARSEGAAATSPHVELAIDAVAQGGDGVARLVLGGERRAVFVPGTLPGERVSAQVDTTSRPARGRLVQVLAPSPARVAPACPDLARCGACALMHVDDGARREVLAGLVREALPEPLRALVSRCEPAAAPLGYRSRARLHVSTKRGAVRVGFHARGTHEPVEVARCVVLDPVLDAARARLPALFAGAEGRGDVHLAFGKPSHDRGLRPVVLDVQFRGELPAGYYAALERAVNDGWLAGARTTLEGARLGSVVGDPRPFLATGGGSLELAVGGFGQASEAGNDALAACAAERAAEALGRIRGRSAAPEAAAPVRVLELHAGAGNLTVRLAPLGDVTAVESDAQACAAARTNLAARGLAAKVVAGDAESFAIPRGTRLVVLDPPRTGAPGVAAALAKARVPAVVYVSCDATTLGRDVGTLLAAGYVAASVDVLDLFPQTAHVETVTVLHHPGHRARAETP